MAISYAGLRRTDERARKAAATRPLVRRLVWLGVAAAVVALVAVALRPQFLDIRNKMARVLIDLGEHEQAVAELDAVLATRPSFAAARVNLGLALYRAGRLDDAEREWQRTLAQLPEHAQAASYLGMLQRQREQRS